ncbi:MAG TPA: tetratricopeptide repeat protein [Chitinophagaceae bacterium]|nr:tetratricopeptide repeat protein [Chitinophagaceae bacterium]
MNKIRLILSAAILMIGSLAMSQNVEQGKRFFYYERYKSAKDVFDKVLASNPNDISAIYWLGQTLLESKDTSGAKALYQKALSTNGSAPLLLVGVGHLELLEGKNNEARQHFETAISLSKAKDIDVLNAIGRANAESRVGDANYAIEKLNLATQIKGFKDPNTYLLIGDAYRKNIDGGGAVTAYTKAMTLDQKLAAAKYKIGKVYLTQNNKDYFLPAFEEAIQIDPAYLPALYELYYYYYFRDVNKAEVYLNQYAANADPGPELDYLKTDFTYARGNFSEARNKAQALISQFGDKVSPRMYKMVAYTADTLGDLTAAKQAMTTYFAKVDTADILPADYLELANINSKVQGSQAEAFENFRAAIARDTAIENKIKYINQAAALAKKLGDRNQEATWLGVAYHMDPNPSQTDLYNWGYAHYQAGNYDSSSRIFCETYETKYPNEIFGYLWCARSEQAKDTTQLTESAAVAYEKLATMAMQIDSVKYKSQAKTALYTLTTYANDVKKDPKAALAYIDRILVMDPDDANAIKIKDILTKAINRPAKTTTPPKKNTSATTKSGGGAGTVKKKN